MIQLSVKCACGQKLARLTGYRSATNVVDRTCRKCGAKWRVIARPAGEILTPAGEAFIHVCNLTCTQTNSGKNHG